ncbi:unnamed protein product [Urochloa humidicola]
MRGVGSARPLLSSGGADSHNCSLQPSTGSPVVPRITSLSPPHPYRLLASSSPPFSLRLSFAWARHSWLGATPHLSLPASSAWSPVRFLFSLLCSFTLQLLCSVSSDVNARWLERPCGRGGATGWSLCAADHPEIQLKSQAGAGATLHQPESAGAIYVLLPSATCFLLSNL